MILPVHRNPARGSAGGFTLLEVLLAFLVFALSFAVVLEILSGSMRNTSRAREYTEVALIAQSVMDQVGLEIPLQAGTEVTGESGKYQWELRIDPFVGDADTAHSLELADLTNIELLEIELAVNWGFFPRERSDQFTTVRAMLKDRREAGE